MAPSGCPVRTLQREYSVVIPLDVMLDFGFYFDVMNLNTFIHIE